MHPTRRSLLVPLLLLLLVPAPAAAQAQRLDRIPVQGGDLWLSGGNIAWTRFARDVGPGPTRLDLFELVFRQLHDAGGNTLRLWLHTDGSVTPEWRDGAVVGPGEGTIEDLRDILDLAQKHHVRLILCLWSFDMLRKNAGDSITDRNYALLTREDELQAYIDHALVPMVTALKGHPAILAWEIFNEPEGMSDEFGWEITRHVPMSDIQRFINRAAGAIKRADPGALVTNGSWSFRATSDVTADEDLLVPGTAADELTEAQVAAIRRKLADRYGYLFTLAETRKMYATLQEWGKNRNYYTDRELVAAGGDPAGTLDFYTVHYYDWGYPALSPFHHDRAFWGLDKPLAVTEFYMDDTFGVPWQQLMPTLYDRGYAGGLGWQWEDFFRRRPDTAHNWPRILKNAQSVRALHPEAVE
ncbi:MAG TPA: cellulase family glycosylhydrolase [Longimicrobiaceae bacterium]|nr:cellulase family glycosylhydrolase [Longimicrobiaceae bacterium]